MLDLLRRLFRPLARHPPTTPAPDSGRDRVVWVADPARLAAPDDAGGDLAANTSASQPRRRVVLGAGRVLVIRPPRGRE